MKKMKRLASLVVIFLLVLFVPRTAYGMHIMEGYLSAKWCIIWALASLPFLLFGIRNLKNAVSNNSDAKLLLGMSGGFTFVLSALKIPSVTGSSSHPTGVGLGAIFFGPTVMTVIGFIVLLFQALLLAHGGLTTLGANTFSMAIVGPFVSYYTYKALRNKNASVAVFLAAALGDLITYVVTSIQLALAFPDPISGFMGSLTSFMTVFAVTQIPLAIVEGIISVMVYNAIIDYREKGAIKIENIYN